MAGVSEKMVSVATSSDHLGMLKAGNLDLKCFLMGYLVEETAHLTEFGHMAHFWMSYDRCTMTGSPMGRSEGLPRRWTGQVLP